MKYLKTFENMAMAKSIISKKMDELLSSQKQQELEIKLHQMMVK